jgi:transcriptional regulator with XRE-family HTH domain
MAETVFPTASEDFRFTPELGRRLRELRKRAGLKQEEVAVRLGRSGPGAKTTISRLELGRSSHPTFGFIVRYLHACGAGFEDIADLMPPRPERKRVRKQLTRDEKVASVRKRAEGLHLALTFEEQLFKLVNDEELLPTLEQRKAMATFGREVFNALLGTRNKVRVAEKELMSTGLIRRADIEGFRDVVVRMFADMEKSGDLDRKLVVDASAVASGRAKLPQVKRAERRLAEDHDRRFRWWYETRNSVIEQIKNESRELHPGLGIEVLQALPYLSVVSDFCKIAEATAPGSEDRKQRFEQRIARANDKHACRVIGELAMRRFDELKGTIPRKPRGK